MGPIQIVSVDLFNTLLDLSSERHILWQTFLGETSTPTRIEQGWKLTSQTLFNAIDQMNATSKYQSLRTVFQACYTEVFERLQVAFDPEEAAGLLVRHHARSPWFPDAVPCLENIQRSLRVCVASDTDEAMVGEHVREYPFDMSFTSERLRVYKGDVHNRFFEAVVAYYALAPRQIIHVGDSPAEIVAAQRAGLRTCWVNRPGRVWPYEYPPDYEIASLAALVSLVGDGNRNSTGK